MIEVKRRGRKRTRKYKERPMNVSKKRNQNENEQFYDRSLSLIWFAFTPLYSSVWWYYNSVVCFFRSIFRMRFFFTLSLSSLLRRKCCWFKERTETQATTTESKRESSPPNDNAFFPFRHVFLFRWNKLNGKYVSISACGDDGLVLRTQSAAHTHTQKRDTTTAVSQVSERKSECFTCNVFLINVDMMCRKKKNTRLDSITE